MNLTSFFLDYVSGNRQYEIDFVRKRQIIRLGELVFL